MCPIVPTLTCGLLRSNFSLAMFTDPRRYLPSNLRSFSWSALALRAPAQQPRPAIPCEAGLSTRLADSVQPRAEVGADVQDRTGDLVLTKDALCQLSYIGLPAAA